MTLILIIGDVGSGKTYIASLIAKYTHNRRILSNYPLDLPNYEPLQPEDLIKLDENEKYLVVIDECYQWLESLTTGSKVEKYLSYILFQSRKRNIDIIVTSQLSRRINVNFREMENLRIECYKDTTNNKFIFTFRYFDRFTVYESTYELELEDASKDWNIYKTKGVVITPELNELALEFVYKDPIKLKNMVNTVSDLIKPNLVRYTKVEIANQLLQLGYSKRLLEPIYNKIKSDLDIPNNKTITKQPII